MEYPLRIKLTSFTPQQMKLEIPKQKKMVNFHRYLAKLVMELT
jgi:hypothetical protein